MNTDGTVDTILVNTPEDTVTRDVSSDVASAGNPKSIRINGSGTAPPSGKKYFIANGKIVTVNPETSAPNMEITGGVGDVTHDFGSSAGRVMRGDISYSSSSTRNVTFTFTVSDDNVNFVPYGEPYIVSTRNTNHPIILPLATFRYLKMTTNVTVIRTLFTTILFVNTFKLQLYNAISSDSDTGNTRLTRDVGFGSTETFELYDVPSGQYLSVRLADTDSADQTAQITELTVVETEA